MCSLHFLYLTLFWGCISPARAVALGDPHTGTTELTSKRALLERQQDLCQPLTWDFTQRVVSRVPFVGVSPPKTYEVNEDGLQMFLRRPKGTITKHGQVNSAVGDGATINSTFAIQYGKVTFELKGPAVAGSITAAILIADGHDEIDVELLGGVPQHWQTNVYAPSPRDTEPLWGVFGEIEDFHSKSSITDFHNYTIDWTNERIVWSVDGQVVRTLEPGQTKINGTEHYPNQPSRVQLGIWDASSPEGTSEWAKGPIDWDSISASISATVRSVRVQCD